MKKTILFLMVSFFFVGISHTAQAQTKEETEAWIIEKLKRWNHINTKVEFTSCALIIEHVDPRSNKINAATGIDLRIGATWSVDENGVIANADVVDRAGEGEGRYRSLSLTEAEPNLRERMAKALNHLTTFCNQGKNEAF